MDTEINMLLKSRKKFEFEHMTRDCSKTKNRIVRPEKNEINASLRAFLLLRRWRDFAGLP